MGGTYKMVRILSVNVSLPKVIDFEGQRITTGIFKEPVEGRVNLRTLNLDGDRQADLTVHGGPDKAVYAYSMEHYDYWHGIFPDLPIPIGMFGENLTVERLIETEVNVGDVFRIGSATVIATQPRMPCYKLGVKFGRMDVLKKFLASGRSGIYFRVLKEGEVAAGDSIVQIREDSNRITISDIVRLYSNESEDLQTMRRAVKVEALPKGWKRYFLEQIQRLEK
ncbi:MAG TPA: MOSC domain-containing protein [Nitrososphaeraceae archaeon]|jgi:MOSC domain-containing protein YiiM|nr:MOSC domain-containing protein [Nitrososphaeraceae archaeon]